MMKEIQERVCGNCKYYTEHYVKLNTQLISLNNGHCVNRVLNTKNTRNKFRLYGNCKFWESNETEKVERKEAIKTVIIQMEKQLSEILMILKDDIYK